MSTSSYVIGTGDETRRLSVRREGDHLVVTAEDGTEHRVSLQSRGAPGLLCARLDGELITLGHVARGGGAHTIVMGGVPHDIELVDARRELYLSLAPADGAGSGRETVKAPIPGLITEIKVEPGQTVERDQTLLVLYAMKLENEIRAPIPGIVGKVHVEPQQPVEKGAPLVELES